MWDLKLFMVCLGNPYHDSQGNPTNGATTGCHLHIGIRVNNEYVNPISYF